MSVRDDGWPSATIPNLPVGGKLPEAGPVIARPGRVPTTRPAVVVADDPDNEPEAPIVARLRPGWMRVRALEAAGPRVHGDFTTRAFVIEVGAPEPGIATAAIVRLARVYPAGSELFARVSDVVYVEQPTRGLSEATIQSLDSAERRNG